MTVQQLIDALQLLPPDLEVQTEGCDCIGDANSVDLMVDPAPMNGAGGKIGAEIRYVLIKR